MQPRLVGTRMSPLEISLLFFVASIAGWYAGGIIKWLFGKMRRGE
jgi:hypothetical protein